MPTLDLPRDELKILQHLLATHVPLAEVWAYGSRVSGNAHEGSDLDLVVRHADDRSQSNLSGLRNALSESDLPILVDVHDWARIPESFRHEIEKTHVVLQSTR